MSKEIIGSKVSELRDVINYSITIRDYVMSKNWEKICSCMDTLGDTDLAINTYFDISDNLIKDISNKHFKDDNYSFEYGIKYLLLYGVLQSMFIQQDAFLGIYYEIITPKEKFREFKKNFFDKYPILKKIRDIRNRAIGHPTNKKDSNTKNENFNFITRWSMAQGYFELSTYNSSKRVKTERIKLKDLWKEQQKIISAHIEEIITFLKNKEKEIVNNSNVRGNKNA
jgi:hypothetical protein